MRTVVYRGPGHVLVAGARTIPRGVPTPISEELYRQLQHDPSMTLQEVDGTEPDAGAEPDENAGDGDEQHAGDGEEDS